MAILKSCEIFFVKLNPKRPNSRFNKKNPTWELQIRTESKEKKKEWEALGLSVKAVIPDDDSKPYYRVNLRKKTIKADGEKASPVKVVNGALEEIDPDTIGNGSVAHIRIYQYEYPDENGGKGIASVLMGVQVVKHIRYVPKHNDDFEMTETETVEAEESMDDEIHTGSDADQSGDY